MKKLFIIPVFALLMSGCATLRNSDIPEVAIVLAAERGAQYHCLRSEFDSTKQLILSTARIGFDAIATEVEPETRELIMQLRNETDRVCGFVTIGA